MSIFVHFVSARVLFDGAFSQWVSLNCLIFSAFPSKHSSWWRRLEDVFRLHLRKTSSRRLDQDEYIRLSLTSSEDVLVKTNIFVLAIRLQDVFKTYHQVKLFLLTHLWEAFNTFLWRFFPKTIIYRGICRDNTTSDKFMVSVQNLQER